MKLRKAIFVTFLVAVMLAVIDICFYVLYTPGFAVLTGVMVVYGFLRGAVDFCHWLCKSDLEPKHLAQSSYDPDPVTDVVGEVFDWATEDEQEASILGDS